MKRLIILNRRFILFFLFHRLNYMKCYISEIFLPRRTRKFGDNVPNRVKRNRHFVFTKKCFIQNSACVSQAKKKVTTCLRKTGRCNINIPDRPRKVQQANGGAFGDGEWLPLNPNMARAGACQG